MDGHEVALQTAARCLDLVLELMQSHMSDFML